MSFLVEFIPVREWISTAITKGLGGNLQTRRGLMSFVTVGDR
ncbi:MAG: hypothetical protein AB1711_05960 [Thermodesulfobacteriota bacterium]